MNKNDIQKIRIDIKSNDESILSMMVCRDGTLARQGNGNLPPEKISVLGIVDNGIFLSLIDKLNENVFPHAGIYDHPNKVGLPITYSIVFIGTEPNVLVFEFRIGTETKDVGDLLPYFDGYISHAAALTNNWYEQEKFKLVV